MLKTKSRYSNLYIFFILIPSFLYLGIFFLYPIYLSFRYSFTNLSLYNLNHFQNVGFTNYLSLFKSGIFIHSIVITIAFVVFSAIIGQMFFGSIIAYILSSLNKYYRTVVTTIILIAWATPQVSAGIAWFSTLSYIPPGTLNSFIAFLGFRPFNFLGRNAAVYSIIFANMWLGLGFSVLLFSAGIQNINPSLIKAATVDGADPISKFFRIIFPLLKDSIITDLILITLFTLGSFTMIFVLTGGGPSNATELLTIYQYRTAFSFFSIGLANAIGVIIIIIGIALSLIYLKIVKIEGNI
ncbi:carbohydrate ABC transporter permease [Picrophilus oshimae]|uniref:Glycerol-3-P ABC transporter permease protein n=1 Tax=Picrophilus torridus (strain ATCC 700027 / DSM 9790 / JCM 10055 / NBRC 100828 / KAW 2/3) TaxID=1122961 RepID=Q6L2X7_PICTO|nr:sugar ABC transporter permease [Picrophilus oshimae]AAT42674.1 glycerol-3-P ABC transporter permease protein [Picrophilus oshimae DSM 9789]